ncbi:hypothetical protein [Limnoglobus roseus]|uniref:Fimbrial assembly family protein n=1 Tax=Limnoglobus roseus TaxID=2598579 RepID=A0A5C1AM46_9BACT|nr:hypothetical protein [Limnoglobus roseus]QEL18802.1 hypothetical protein PX52LOC_05842 [Limnoglobus roseus]
MARYLAIDADAHGLTVASGTVRSGVVHLEQTLSWTENPQPLSPSTAGPLGRKLAELLKTAGIAPAPVLFAIGRDRIILKEIKHPPSPPQDEPAVVRFQAIKELTESPDDGVLDYLPLGSDAAGERRASVAFLHNDQFKSFRAMCDAANLKLAGVTPRPFAAASAAARAVTTGAVPAPDSADAATAVVTLGESAGEFTVVKAGLVRFSRPISAMATANEATLVAELRKNLNVYSAQAAGDAIQAIYLAEGETGSGGWSGRLGASLPVPVHAFDPLAGSPAAERIPPRIRSRFAGVVGLLAGKAKIGPAPMNFAQPRQPRAAVNPNRNRLAVAALLGIVLLAALGFGGYVLVRDAEARTTALRAEVARLDDGIKNLEPDVKRLAAAEEYDRRNVPWLDEIYDLSVHFPDINKMKVVAYVGDALPPPTNKQKAVAQGPPPAPGQPAAVATPVTPAVKAVPGPVAKIRLTVVSENPTLPQELVQALARESRFYSGVRMTTGALLPGGTSRTPVQQFFIDANVVRRAPVDYAALLRVTLPKPVAAAAERPAVPDPDDLPGDPLGGLPDGGANP